MTCSIPIIIILVRFKVMAADSDGDLIETVVTCEGDLGDPEFALKFKVIVERLETLLCQGKYRSYSVLKYKNLPYYLLSNSDLPSIKY